MVTAPASPKRMATRYTRRWAAVAAREPPVAGALTSGSGTILPLSELDRRAAAAGLAGVGRRPGRTRRGRACRTGGGRAGRRVVGLGWCCCLKGLRTAPGRLTLASEDDVLTLTRALTGGSHGRSAGALGDRLLGLRGDRLGAAAEHDRNRDEGGEQRDRDGPQLLVDKVTCEVLEEGHGVTPATAAVVVGAPAPAVGVAGLAGAAELGAAAVAPPVSPSAEGSRKALALICALMFGKPLRLAPIEIAVDRQQAAADVDRVALGPA